MFLYFINGLYAVVSKWIFRMQYVQQFQLVNRLWWYGFKLIMTQAFGLLLYSVWELYTICIVNGIKLCVLLCRLRRTALPRSHCTMLPHCCCIMGLSISTYSMPMHVSFLMLSLKMHKIENNIVAYDKCAADIVWLLSLSDHKCQLGSSLLSC